MAERPTLTLQDIALAARVERAVVSVWRQRPTTTGGRLVHFPDAVASTGGTETFDREEIVAYLRATGRGKNPEVAQDALALSAPDGVDIEEVVTLLCLHALSGEQLADHRDTELVALARRVDPRDDVLFVRLSRRLHRIISL